MFTVNGDVQGDIPHLSFEDTVHTDTCSDAAINCEHRLLIVYTCYVEGISRIPLEAFRHLITTQFNHFSGELGGRATIAQIDLKYGHFLCTCFKLQKLLLEV